MRKALWLVIPALVAGYVWLGDDDDDDRETANEVDDSAEVSWNNRVWIDEIPTSERHKINALVVADDPQIGLFQNTSFYEGDYSVFAWRAKADGVVKIEMLQSDKSHKLKIKTGTKDCGRFDYCMTVKGAPRGAKKYYSMKDWVIEGAHSPSDISARASALISAQIE
jgi:hypothetical protein